MQVPGLEETDRGLAEAKVLASSRIGPPYVPLLMRACIEFYTGCPPHIACLVRLASDAGRR